MKATGLVHLWAGLIRGLGTKFKERPSVSVEGADPIRVQSATTSVRRKAG